MSRDLLEEILALDARVWPGDAELPRHDPALDPVSMSLVDDDRVVATLDILSKEIEHAGQRFAASGLSMVATDPEHRRQGLGLRLVGAARDEIARRGADLGIFTCDTPLRAFYERAGWEVLPGSVLVGGTPAEPVASDQFDKVVLASFLTERAQRARESFVGTRIALYPGLRDRLW